MQREDPTNKQLETSAYHRQVIIDFFSEGGMGTETSQALESKWNTTHSGHNTFVVDGKDLMDENVTLPKEEFDGQITKIYVLGHGIATRPDLLRGADNLSTNPEQLADALAKYIGTQSNVCINLIICEAAKTSLADNIKDSFAAQVHLMLCQKLGRDIPLIARDEPVRVIHADNESKGRKWTVLKGNANYADELILEIEKAKSKPDNEIEVKNLQMKLALLHASKQPGSKWIFTLDKEGNQIRIDAYAYKRDLQWKDKVLQFLNKMVTTQTNHKVLPTIKNWLRIFADKSPEDIYLVISKEIACNSYMKKSFFTSLIGRDELGKGLEDSVLERDKMLKATNGNVPSNPTGNGSPFRREIKEKEGKTAVTDNKLSKLESEAFMNELLSELDFMIEQQTKKDLSSIIPKLPKMDHT